MGRPRAKQKNWGSRKTDLAIGWQDYSCLRAGTYRAYCYWARQYYDRAFRRWTCLLRFGVYDDNGVEVAKRVPMWLSLGDGEEPRASRRGNYLKTWVEANDGPPIRGDRLSPRVFVHRFARVEVGDTTRGPAPYSVVKNILLWETGKVGHSVSKSHSQGRHRKKARGE